MAQVATGSLFLRLMSASVAIANHSGNIIREILKKGNLRIVDKGINDLQTEADRSVQRCIINSLLKQFPKITIIGEETLEKLENEDEFTVNVSNCAPINAKCPEQLASVKEEDIVVWVDPLDGTAEYVQGFLDHVTVLIGFAVNGKAVGGVIHQPYFNYESKAKMVKISAEGPRQDSLFLQRAFQPVICPKEEDISKLGRTIWGIVGSGIDGIDCKQPPENKRIIAITRSHSNQIIVSTVEALKPDEVLRVGGAGHKVLLLLEGKAHAYVFPSKGTKKWDTCAAEAILHAFGGKLTDIFGKPIQYHSTVEHQNSTGILATYAESVHDWYIANMPQETKESLKQ